MNRRDCLRTLLPGALLPMLMPAPLHATGLTLLRRLRFTVTFSNPHQRSLPNQRFWCYLPANLPQQQLRQVQVSMPHQIESDPLGHRILALVFDEVAPLAQKVVSVTVELAVDPAVAQSALPDPAAWLHAERFIEVGDARIAAQAAALQRAHQNEGARAIFDWVQNHIRYAGYVADDLGALHALTQGRGDCTEYADLVVALARANRIPARMVGGYVVNGDATPRPQDYHNWAELYLDGRWRVLDAQKGEWLPDPGRYLAFRIYRDVPINHVGLAHRYYMQGELEVKW